VAARSRAVAVLAHPLTLGLDAASLDRVLEELAAAGLAGMECYYGRYSPEQRAGLVEVARRHDVVATGGSDFHGSFKPDLVVGTELATSTCRTLHSKNSSPASPLTILIDASTVFAAHVDSWQAQGRLRELYGGGTAEYAGWKLMSSGLDYSYFNAACVTDSMLADIGQAREWYAHDTSPGALSCRPAQPGRTGAAADTTVMAWRRSILASGDALGVCLSASRCQ